jgi:ectoine hydroxylase-related dioxygenase (phytanoyl-CoA dioxygenase family)
MHEIYTGLTQGRLIDHKHLEDFRIEDKDINYEREVAIPLKAGSCCFHHSKVLHRTGPNLSSNTRIGVTIGYMSSKTKYTGEKPKPRYLLVSGKEYRGFGFSPVYLVFELIYPMVTPILVFELRFGPVLCSTLLW